MYSHPFSVDDIGNPRQWIQIARERFTEAFFWLLVDKAGGEKELLLLTQDKSEGEIEFVIDQLLPEAAISSITIVATHHLLDKQALFEALGCRAPSVELDD